MTHPSKAVVYTGISLVCLFIIMASLWYRHEFIKEQAVTRVITTATHKKEKNAITETTAEYDIDIVYPIILGAHSANTELLQMYTKKASDFKEQVAQSRTDMPQELVNEKVASYYDSGFVEVASSSRYSSYLIRDEKYFVGAAHPSHDISTIIFDKKLDRIVQTNELFTSPTYVQVLSKITKKLFSERNNKVGQEIIIDVTTSNNGFDPVQENFSTILPTKDGLVVYFKEYQIAPYVDGPQEITIPYEMLTSVLNKESVVAEYLK